MEKSNNLTLTALSVSDVVRIFMKSGARNMTEDKVRADVAAGAPVNPDGSMNVIHYAAWLAKELTHDRD